MRDSIPHDTPRFLMRPSFDTVGSRPPFCNVIVTAESFLCHPTFGIVLVFRTRLPLFFSPTRSMPFFQTQLSTLGHCVPPHYEVVNQASCAFHQGPWTSLPSFLPQSVDYRPLSGGKPNKIWVAPFCLFCPTTLLPYHQRYSVDLLFNLDLMASDSFPFSGRFCPAFRNN